jgi:hypothetical protein
MTDHLLHEIQQIRQEIDDTVRLSAWLHERAWPADVRQCQHKHATMVQADGKLGWFVTWQCDDCGASLADRPVTMDDLDHGRDLPRFDADLYRRGLERLEHGRVNTMAFFDRAVRR